MTELQKNSVTKVKAQYTKLTLNRENIDKVFVTLTNRRDIRNATVNKLVKVLESGQHFETPFMANMKADKYRLLDGNHRHEAVRKYLDKNPDRKVEVAILFYQNLTVDEEKEMYTKWNLGAKQSTNDMVKQYWNDIPVAKMFDKASGTLPYWVGHKWGRDTIELKTLASCYLTKDEKVFNGGFSGAAWDFVEQVKELKQKDFDMLKEFMKEYVGAFGKPDNVSQYYKQATFFAIQRIWLDNVGSKTPDDIHKGFMKLVGNRWVVEYAALGGTRENCKILHKALVDTLNGQRSKNLFV